MIEIGLEHATLEACVVEAQHDRVIVTRNGVPVALVVGVEGLDAEQVLVGSSDPFWRMIAERRSQAIVDRVTLEASLPPDG